MEVGRRQLEDFQARPVEQQLAIGTVFDPTNAIGAGVLTKGLRAAGTAPRVGRLTGSILRGAARANEVADVAQARFAPEILGGTAGAIGGMVYGDDQGDVLKGAAVGALAGTGTRLLSPALRPRQSVPGSVVDAFGENADDYLETLAKYDIEARVGPEGQIEVVDENKLKSVLEEMRVERSKVHRIDREPGKVRDLWGKRVQRPGQSGIIPGAGYKKEADYLRLLDVAAPDVRNSVTGLDVVLDEPIGDARLRITAEELAARRGYKTPERIRAEQEFINDINAILEEAPNWRDVPRRVNQMLTRTSGLTGVADETWRLEMRNFIAGETEEEGIFRRAMGLFDNSDPEFRVDVPEEPRVPEAVPEQRNLMGEVEQFPQPKVEPQQADLGLEGGAGTRVPMNQTDFLADVPNRPPEDAAARVNSPAAVRRRAAAEVTEVGAAPTSRAGQLPLDRSRAPVTDPTIGQPSGLGQGARGAETNLGVAPETPENLPPRPPTEPPDPQTLGVERPFGGDEPQDLFGIGRAEEGRARAQLTQDRSTMRGRAGERLTTSGTLRSEPVAAVRADLEQSSHIINDWLPAQVERADRALKAAGMRFIPDETGQRFVLEGTNSTLADIVEGATPEGMRIYSQLTPSQREAIDVLNEINRVVTDNARFHGVEIPLYDTATGEWLPRQVVAREVSGGRIDKNVFRQPSGRSIGTNRIGQRSQASELAGADAGLVYAHPLAAFEAGMRAKLLMAQDAALAARIQPFAADGGRAGFGYRPLRGNHPALSKVKFVGQADSRAALLGNEKAVFPNEIADELDDLLSPNRLSDTKLGRAGVMANQVTVPIRASMDASFFLNQGLGFLESSPRNAIKAFKALGTTLASASGSPTRYFDDLGKELDRAGTLLGEAGVKADPQTYLIQRGMHWASEMNPDEFIFPVEAKRGVRAALGKAGVPVAKGIQWSNETFARYLNFARTTMATDLLERGVAQGLTGRELDQFVSEGIRAINRSTGWTRSNPTSLESIGMFAPRFFRSQAEQIAVAASKGGIEGSMARQHLLKMAATGVATVTAVNALRGYETDYDPRSPNFMRIRNVFGHDISPFGSFATLIRGVSQGVGGDPYTGERGIPVLANFARAKAAPWAGTAWSIVTGESYDGRPFTLDVVNHPKEAAQGLADVALDNLPFSVQAFRDAGGVSANPENVAEGLGAFLFSGSGAQSSEVSPAEKRDFARDRVANDLFGQAYDDLSGADKAVVNRDERVSELQAEVERRGLERKGDSSKITEVNVEFREKMKANGEFLQAGQDAAGNPFSGNDYREAYEQASLLRRGALGVLDSNFQPDDVVDGYFALYDEATMANGQIDYELFNRLEAEYLREHPDALERIDKVTGAQDDEVLAMFRVAQDQAREYYSLPAYAGTTLEESNRINAILKDANSRVAIGAAAGRSDAFKQMVEDGAMLADEVNMVRAALRRGANPERREFRTTHEEFRIFYSDAVGVSDLPMGVPRDSGGGSSRSRFTTGRPSGSSGRRR